MTVLRIVSSVFSMISCLSRVFADPWSTYHDGSNFRSMTIAALGTTLHFWLSCVNSSYSRRHTGHDAQVCLLGHHVFFPTRSSVLSSYDLGHYTHYTHSSAIMLETSEKTRTCVLLMFLTLKGRAMLVPHHPLPYVAGSLYVFKRRITRIHKIILNVPPLYIASPHRCGSVWTTVWRSVRSVWSPRATNPGSSPTKLRWSFPSTGQQRTSFHFLSSDSLHVSWPPF